MLKDFSLTMVDGLEGFCKVAIDQINSVSFIHQICCKLFLKERVGKMDSWKSALRGHYSELTQVIYFLPPSKWEHLARKANPGLDSHKHTN